MEILINVAAGCIVVCGVGLKGAAFIEGILQKESALVRLLRIRNRTIRPEASSACAVSHNDYRSVCWRPIIRFFILKI